MAKETDGLLLTASLNIEETANIIKKEDIAKLNNKLANDDTARVKIIGGLDLSKTQSLIQSQIATISKNLKLNIGQIDTSGLNTKSIDNNLTNSLKNTENQTQKITNSINSQISSFKQSLQNIGMDDNIINNIINRIEALNVEITSLHQSTNGKAITVNVGGIDKLGQAIKLTQEYSTVNGELKKSIDDVSTATSKGNAQLENLMAQQTKRRADLTNQINQVYKSAIDPNASRSIADQSRLTALKSQYDEVITAISNMSGATKTAFAESEAEVTKLISALKTTISEYKNAENVSTTLKPDKLTSAISKAESEFTTLKAKIDNTKVSSDKLTNSINEIETILSKPKNGEVINKADIESAFTALSKAKSELNALVKIKTSDSSIEKVKIQAETLLNELNTFSTKNVGFDKFEQTINGSVISVKSLQEVLANVTSTADLSKVKTQFTALKQFFNSSTTDVKKYSDAIETTISKLTNIQNSPVFLKNFSNSDVEQMGQKIIGMITEYQRLSEMLKSNNLTPSDIQNAISKFKELETQFQQVSISAKNLKSSISADNSMQRQAQNAELLVEKVKKLRSEIIAYQNANSKAMKSQATSLNGITYSAEIDGFLATLKNASSVTDAEFKKISASFRTLKAEVKSAGLEGSTMLDSLWANVKKFSNWMGITMVTASIAREVRGMFTDVAELDEALIDLRKTFQGTSEDLQSFYYSANDVAKQLGVTTQEVINTASSWSRLGYSTAEAATKMAELSSMFASISPNMDIETATNGLVSIMKAFDVDVDNVKEKIMSSINEVGNTFAVSNGDIVEGLQLSSAAMASMGSSLEETISLFTAGNEILQDASQMGNALRSISMRVRGYDESTEQLSDDLVDISGKVIDLTKVASNDYKGVSLFTDETQEHYKSIYEYLTQIADIYDELSEKNQQELLEKLFGKNRAQAGAAILTNIDAAKDAMEVISGSMGSADREMEVIMDSVSYKANELKETLVGIAQDSITQDFLKSVLESATRILNTLSDASSPLNFILTQIANLLELVTKLTDKIGVIPTILGGLTLKNVGKLKS